MCGDWFTACIYLWVPGLQVHGLMSVLYEDHINYWVWPRLSILTVFFSVSQYKGAHVKPGFAEHFYSNPGRYKGRENMLVSQNLISK